MLDINNQNTESDYLYSDSSNQIKEKIPVEGANPTRSTQTPNCDELSLSTVQDKALKTPPIDAPELPIPTPKGVKTAEIRREITEEARNNLWLSSPSYLSGFLSKFWDLLDILSDSRFAESQLNQTAAEGSLEIGMKNADLAKWLKETEAGKELMKAASSTLNSRLASYKSGRMNEVKDEIEQTEKIASLKRQIEGQEKALDKMKGKGTALKLTDEANPAKVESDLAQTPQASPEEIEKAESDLEELKLKYSKKSRKETEKAKQAISSSIDLIQSSSEGLVNVLVGIYGQYQGYLDKNKQINEVLAQLFSKTDEGGRKVKEDLQDQLDRIIQQISQTSSENTKAHLIGRG